MISQSHIRGRMTHIHNTIHNCVDVSPANTRHWLNVGSILAHRLWRWPDIEQALGQCLVIDAQGGGPRAVVSTAAFHARVRGSFPGLGGLKQTKLFLPNPLVKLSIVGGLRDREVPCSISDLQGFNFESCVWKAVSSHSFHHLQEVSWPNLPCMCTKVA